MVWYELYYVLPILPYLQIWKYNNNNFVSTVRLCYTNYTLSNANDTIDTLGNIQKTKQCDGKYGKWYWKCCSGCVWKKPLQIPFCGYSNKCLLSKVSNHLCTPGSNWLKCGYLLHPTYVSVLCGFLIGVYVYSFLGHFVTPSCSFFSTRPRAGVSNSQSLRFFLYGYFPHA